MANRFDLASALNSYESGQMDESEMLEMFQHMVDTGIAWQLQGSYGRMASRLIESGQINPPARWNS